MGARNTKRRFRREREEAAFNVHEMNMGPVSAELDIKVGIGGRAAYQGERDYTPRRRWNRFPIDTKTGIIQVRGASRWQGCKTKREVGENSNLVRAFQLSITVPEADSADYVVLVTQRDAQNNYVSVQYRKEDGLRIYDLPAFEVMCSARSEELQKIEQAPPIAVYTANKALSNCGSNRVDIWVLEKTGRITSFQVVIQTLDDGETFRLFVERHWGGEWCRLAEPRAYEPTAHQEVFENEAIKSLLEPLICLPDDTCPGFDQKAQILLTPTIRNFLSRNTEHFPVFDGPDRNVDILFAPTSQFTDSTLGYVKLWDLTRAGGFGIIERLTATGEIETLQFRCRSFEQGGVDLGDNSAPNIVRGDLVSWETVHDMGTDTRTGKPYPPLALGMQVVSQTAV